MIHKGDNMKQKASAKETENEKATEEEKISENHTNKGFISKIYKELL